MRILIVTMKASKVVGTSTAGIMSIKKATLAQEKKGDGVKDASERLCAQLLAGLGELKSFGAPKCCWLVETSETSWYVVSVAPCVNKFTTRILPFTQQCYHKQPCRRGTTTRSLGYTRAVTATDVWSVGCLLYELLTGEFLFREVRG